MDEVVQVGDHEIHIGLDHRLTSIAQLQASSCVDSKAMDFLGGKNGKDFLAKRGYIAPR